MNLMDTNTMQSSPKSHFSGWLLTMATALFLFAGPLGPKPIHAEDETTELMDLIKARGKLVVGVKTDYPPWGGIDEDAKKVGLEPDLARDLARRLGVGLE